MQISECEDLLGFSKHNSVAVWSELRSTTESFLSRRQFLDFLTSLSLNREGFDGPTRPLHRFYALFRQNNLYDKRKLALLGLLLGHGASHSKVDILFQMHSAEELKQSEMERVLREMLLIASVDLPSYSQYWMEVTSNDEKASEISHYREKLVVSIPDAVSTLVKLLFGNGEVAISREICKNRIRGDLAQSIFIAKNLRMLSLDVYKRGKIERLKRKDLVDRRISF